MSAPMRFISRKAGAHRKEQSSICPSSAGVLVAGREAAGLQCRTSRKPPPRPRRHVTVKIASDRKRLGEA